MRFFNVQAPDGEGAGGGNGSAAGAAAAGAAAGAEAAGAAAGASGASSGGAQAAASASAGAGAGAGAAAGGEGTSSGTPPAWDADHWRSTWAGNDEGKKKWAERRTDLKVALDSAYSAQAKIDELTAVAKTVLPKDATAEQIAQYRKENSIPEKPEAYFEALPKEVRESLDDTAKAIITPYLNLMHERNISPKDAAALMGLRQAEANRWAEQRIEQDTQVRQQTEDSLRQEWGANYRAEVNNVKSLLDGAPPEVRDMMFDARLPDGRGLLATTEAMRYFAQLARTVNPYSAPIGNDGGTLDQKGVEGRIGEIEALMTQPKGSVGYRQYYDSESVQKEYRALLGARETMRKRA